MNYNININQKAIVELNNDLVKKLDLKDATILEWMLKFHAEPKSKKIMLGDHVYFWGAYQLIINENPLLNIDNKQTLSRKIDKLIDAGLLYKYLNKDKGNKTYFSITQKCFDFIKRDSHTLLTKKSIATDKKVNTLLTKKSNNNNIIDNIYSGYKEKVINQERIYELLHIETKREIEFIKSKVDEFIEFIKSIDERHDNTSRLHAHFMKWFKMRYARKPLSDSKDVTKELDYFLLRFNQISRKTYHPTKQLEDLLRVQLENGFTSEQMAIAIKKMRSSDDRNWHKKTLFLHATPEHLLKDNNLNKYLNQNF